VVAEDDSSMALRALVALRALIVALALFALPIHSAEAQGFWQSLFGGGKPAAAPPPKFPRPQTSAPGAAPFSGFFSPYQPLGFDGGFAQDRGAYRTLCVRMCDGFYFPISYSTGRSGFARDADKCAAACGEEARLFYYPNPGGEIEDMVDLTGRAYASFATAFKYRKTLVKGCQCRPQPWSEVELARHRSYAEAQVPAATEPAVASREPVRVSSYEPGPEAPRPIDRRELEVLAPAVPAPATAYPPAVAGTERPAARPRPVAPQKQASDWSWLFGEPAKPQRTRRAAP
jgi:hypothetical protein